MKSITIYDLPIQVNDGVEAIYSNSDFGIYEENNQYYISCSKYEQPWLVGSAQDVLEFYMQFID